MKSILRQAKQIVTIKEEFKTLFAKKTTESKAVTKTTTKEKVAFLEEEMI